MKRSLAERASEIWYGNSPAALFLLPLAYLFAGIVRLRRAVYKCGIKSSHMLPVPVVVVGNITLGGTGKTPLVIWLAEMLIKAGYKPGIISRGYGGCSKTWPLAVGANTGPVLVGDEPYLIARQTNVPVVVGPSRVEAAQKLLAEFDCDVLISDDGLQHYKLNRDIEIAVIDGERRFGNGYCLPAGPLREPVERLNSVDFIVVNGEKTAGQECSMRLIGDEAVNLVTGERTRLAEFAGGTCHALAGIGNPQRFFKLLESKGLICQAHSFPDHYAFSSGDIAFGDGQPVFMTEKDAVKCLSFAKPNHWSVPVTAVLGESFERGILDLIKQKQHDR